MAKKPNGVQESLDFIIKRMATKEDVREIVNEIVDEIVEKKLEPVKKTLAEHTQILNDHTGQLNHLQSDMNIMRDKRMKLEVRSDAIEKHLNLKPPVGTVS